MQILSLLGALFSFAPIQSIAGVALVLERLCCEDQATFKVGLNRLSEEKNWQYFKLIFT